MWSGSDDRETWYQRRHAGPPSCRARRPPQPCPTTRRSRCKYWSKNPPHVTISLVGGSEPRVAGYRHLPHFQGIQYQCWEFYWVECIAYRCWEQVHHIALPFPPPPSSINFISCYSLFTDALLVHCLVHPINMFTPPIHTGMSPWPTCSLTSEPGCVMLVKCTRVQKMTWWRNWCSMRRCSPKVSKKINSINIPINTPYQHTHQRVLLTKKSSLSTLLSFFFLQTSTRSSLWLPKKAKTTRHCSVYEPCPRAYTRKMNLDTRPCIGRLLRDM